MDRVGIYINRILVLFGVVRLLLSTFFIRIKTGKPIVVFGLVEHIGDIICATPVYLNLTANRYVDKELVWFANKRHHSAIQIFTKDVKSVATKNLDQFYYFKRVMGLFKIDIVDLNLHGKKLEYFNGKYKNTFDQVRLENYLDNGSLSDVFALLGGVRSSVLQAPLFTMDSSPLLSKLGLTNSKYIVFHCKSNMVRKDWSNEKWDQLVKTIAERSDIRIVEIGMQRILKEHPSIIDCTAKLSLLETAGIISSAHCYLGVDSGPAHLANFLGVDSSILLGAFGKFKSYNPYHKFDNSKLRIIDNFPNQVNSIKVDQVFKNIEPWI